MTTNTTKTITALLAAITLATSLTAFGGQAQAQPSWGWGVGAGIVAGTLIGAAAVNNAYYGYRDCHWVQRVDYWGNVRTFKVCD